MNAEHQDAGGQAAKKEGIGWLPFVSLGCSILSLLLMLARDEAWGYDEHKGIVALGLAGLAIGILCVRNQRRGRTSAMIGIFIGAITSFIGLIWLFSKI